MSRASGAPVWSSRNYTPNKLQRAPTMVQMSVEDHVGDDDFNIAEGRLQTIHVGDLFGTFDSPTTKRAIEQVPNITPNLIGAIASWGKVRCAEAWLGQPENIVSERGVVTNEFMAVQVSPLVLPVCYEGMAFDVLGYEGAVPTLGACAMEKVQSYMETAMGMFTDSLPRLQHLSSRLQQVGPFDAQADRRRRRQRLGLA